MSSNAKLPSAVVDAIDALSDLPGIGARSAERLVLTLLRQERGLDQKIARTLGTLRDNVQECPVCCHLCDAHSESCPICASSRRSTSTVCIVSEPSDVLALERTHSYQGVYHVLHGVISPLHRVRPEDVRIHQLLERVRAEGIDELIFALPANAEGESTTLYILEKLKDIFHGTITRLARGIPSGGDLDYVDTTTLTRALTDRRGVITRH